ncbi:MAG: aminoacyl-tRNA hydrolase [Clostridia bacterium]|nr:aminoacyl-tRNA hydrolase [Clostridia bacterium]
MFLKKDKGGTFDYLVAGLGNPGREYENTRHNAGFVAADMLSDKFNISVSKSKFDALYGDGTIAGARVLVVKPQTYMNLSGTAVQKLSAFYKIPVDKIIIMHDDVSLDVGKIRIRRKGSAGGQKGLANIIQMLGTEEIPRIKIGVGAKPHPDYDMKDWVLGKIPSEQENDFKAACINAVKAVEEIIARGIDSAMNKYSK